MEPRRLLDDNPSQIERALLNAGTAYRCSANSRAGTLTALGLAGSAALSAAGLGVSVASVVAKFGWTKIILAVAALGTVTSVPIGYYFLTHYHQPTVANVIEPVTVEKASQQTMPANPHNDVVPAERIPETQVPGDTALHAVTPAKSEAKLESSSPLSEELSALDAVRSLLARGDAVSALSRLDSYNRNFPKGRLQLEAEVLRIDALMKSGQTEQAKARAQAFLTRHPNSVLTTRVRSLLQR